MLTAAFAATFTAAFAAIFTAAFAATLTAAFAANFTAAFAAGAHVASRSEAFPARTAAFAAGTASATPSSDDVVVLVRAVCVFGKHVNSFVDYVITPYHNTGPPRLFPGPGEDTPGPVGGAR